MRYRRLHWLIRAISEVLWGGLILGLFVLFGVKECQRVNNSIKEYHEYRYQHDSANETILRIQGCGECPDREMICNLWRIKDQAEPFHSNCPKEDLPYRFDLELLRRVPSFKEFEIQMRLTDHSGAYQWIINKLLKQL